MAKTFLLSINFSKHPLLRKGKKLIGSLLFLIFTGCFTAHALMTQETFNQIHEGTTIAELDALVGEPYAIHSTGADAEEYEYIEKIEQGNVLIAENHYFLIISGGVVIGKHKTRESPPAYDLLYQEDPNYNSFP